jgi:hypothetical protein
MVKVEFIKKFATKKKGEIVELDSALASRLIHFLKVAKKRVRATKKDVVN